MVQTAPARRLSEDLLALRGVQWLPESMDDPYARLLRAAGDDPGELGRRIRERGPVSLSLARVWVTASYEPGAAILADPRLSPRHPGAGTAEEEAPWDVPALGRVLPLEDAFVTLDRAEYDRLARRAGPMIADALEGRRREIADLHRARVRRPTGGFDLMTGFARDAAVTVLGDLLGLPPALRGRFAALCAGAAGTLDATFCPPRLATARELLAALAGLRELLGETIPPARPSPGERPADGPPGASADLDDRPADALAVRVLLAAVGTDTAANLVCEAVAALLDHPQQLRLLREDPGLAPAAIEETLRYAPPIRLHRRYAHQDVEIAGRRIEAGQEVVVVAEAANRDPEAYAGADRFDLTRRPVRHLTLPAGSPAAVVAPFVRAQAAAAVSAVVAGLPDVRRAGDVLRRLRSPATAAVLRSPVRTG
ncbi:cytochrome P450 family protein [Streptosporangium sp. LJ11]|uniref:cytochrome P450 family protein n=1 Tax=Streptosporangium sp. LJ11 TaxID=3436927 RepID=UPI003F790C6D